MRDSVARTPVGAVVIMSVVSVIEEVRVSWVVCTVETEEEGGDISVVVSPATATVEAEVADEVTFLPEVTVVTSLSVSGEVV